MQVMLSPSCSTIIPLELREKPVHIVVGNDELTVNKAVTQLVKVVPLHEKYLK